MELMGMTKEEADDELQSIIGDVSDLVGSGHYTLEEVVSGINDALVHLVPE